MNTLYLMAQGLELRPSTQRMVGKAEKSKNTSEDRIPKQCLLKTTFECVRSQGDRCMVAGASSSPTFISKFTSKFSFAKLFK